MLAKQEDNLQSPGDENESDNQSSNDDNSVQSPTEEGEMKKDPYYEVDEKKLVITSIGDGTPHEEGLAETDDEEDRQQD